MKRRLSYYFITCVTLFLCLSAVKIHAQGFIPLKDSLHSVVLKENRNIQVFVPDDYKAGSSKKYDVTYVLDGEWNTPITKQTMLYLTNQGFMPLNIIVSIPNVYIDQVNMREKNFTPSHVTEMPYSGGADSFLLFLKNELVPFVNKKYPSSGKNMIFGQSLSGLFAMYALLKEPALFQSYLLADPSFWYDNGAILKLAENKLNGTKYDGIALWVVGRKGKPFIRQRIAAMDSVLKRKAHAGMHWMIREEPYETHPSTQVKTLYDGLKFAYRGYVQDNIALIPGGGTVLTGKPFKIWSYNYFVDDMHYTTDGSDPTMTSAAMEDEMSLILTSSSKLTVASFCNRPEYNRKVSANFKTGEVLSPEPTPHDARPGGLEYQYFEGNWDKLPDLAKLHPSRSGLMDKDFDINKYSDAVDAAFMLNGYMEIKEDGYYTFQLNGGSGSDLYLGNKLLIGNDEDGVNGKSRSYVVPLAKGYYPFKLEVFRKKGSTDFTLNYNTPASGTAFIAIPYALFYGNK